MSKEELLKVIQQQVSQEIDNLQREADERLAMLRKECAVRIRAGRREIRKHYQRMIKQELQHRQYVFQKSRLSQFTQLRRELADRMKELSLPAFKLFWEKERETLLPRLIAELPDVEWSDVRVSPKDHDLAQTLLPDVRLTPDPTLDGGLVATCDQRQLVCRMDLETLLERVWPTMIPALLEKAYENA